LKVKGRKEKIFENFGIRGRKTAIRIYEFEIINFK